MFIGISVPTGIFLFGVDFVDLFSSLVFLDYISPLTFVVKLGWWYWILLTFACLKSFCFVFISPWILNEILASYSNLGCRFFPFSTLNISYLSLLACRVSAERAVKSKGFPLYVTCCFSLAAFNILSLCLAFVSFISMCLGAFLLGFILYGTLWDSWTWLTVSFSTLGKFSTIISSKFSHTLSFSLLLLAPL